MSPLLDWLRQHGCDGASDDRSRLLAKRTAWVVEVEQGMPVGWRHVAPLVVEECPRHPRSATGSNLHDPVEAASPD